MGISVTQPVDPAIKRTGQILFKPFDIKKWFVLGFCAWLAMLGEGGGGNFQMPNFGGGGGGGPAPAPAPIPPPPFPGGGGGTGTGAPNFPTFPPTRTQTPQDEFWAFIAEAQRFFFNHAWWIVPLICVMLILWIALLWVRARGKFMFLDGVANDRAAVVEPWKRFAVHANSFFRFELTITVLLLGVIALIGGVAYLIAAGDIRTGQMSGAGVAAIGVSMLGLLCAVLAFGITSIIAEDFLIPLMYLRDCTIGPAWREFRDLVVPGNFWSLVLYFLMLIVLGIAAGVAALILVCGTCFLAALPYIGAVVMLPITVFFRCYSLYFLGQIGPNYKAIVERMPQLSAFPVIMPGQPYPYPGPYADPGVVPPPAPPDVPPGQWPPPPQQR
jgi:hypothetical protein